MTPHGGSLLCFEDKRGECFLSRSLVSRILGETGACGLLPGQGPTRRTCAMPADTRCQMTLLGLRAELGPDVQTSSGGRDLLEPV